jgi:hypothetical protein
MIILGLKMTLVSDRKRVASGSRTMINPDFTNRCSTWAMSREAGKIVFVGGFEV